MSQQTSPEPSLSSDSAEGAPGRATRFRWVICALLFFATTINYLDRSVINVVGPTIKVEQGWTSYQYGLINASFSLAYALGFVFMGRLIDLLGVRITYAFALVFWSLAAAAHSLAGGALSFGVARFFLGLGESGNFPAAIKTVAEWFPQKERATATGIFNAGSNVGAILAPLIVPILVGIWHWQAAFIVTGLIGLVWVFFWLPIYRAPQVHPRVNARERAIILGDDVGPVAGVGAGPSAGPVAAAVAVPVGGGAVGAGAAGPGNPPAVKWRNLLPYRQTWAFMVGKFLTDPIWWFYNTFAGLFFAEKFGMDIKKLGPPLIIIYVLADFGSIAGGWLSSTLIHRGWTPNAARKLAMFTCALFVLPVIYAPITENWVLSCTLIGVAAAAHQGFSANIFTLTSDMFPKRAVGSVVGLGGFTGAIGGMIAATVAGLVREVTGTFVIMFIAAGFVYVLAVAIVHMLVPSLTRLTESQLERTRIPVPVWCVVWAIVGFLGGVPLSYQFQDHTMPNTQHFPQYMSDVMSGDIFKITPPKPAASAPATQAAAEGATSRPLPAEPTAAGPTTAPAAAASGTTAGPVLSEAEQRANRAKMGQPLLFTPLVLAGLMAAAGAVVHGVLLRSRDRAA
jgi:ACS family hexuronate transporter-like MFS transporter